MIFPSHLSVLCIELYAELWAFIPDRFHLLYCYVNYTFLFYLRDNEAVVFTIHASGFARMSCSWFLTRLLEFLSKDPDWRFRIAYHLEFKSQHNNFSQFRVSNSQHLAFYKRGGRWNKMPVEKKISIILPVFGVTGASKTSHYCEYCV